MAQLDTSEKDRRASRAWRLSPAGAAAAADADQHREHRAWRARNWVPAPDPSTEISNPAEVVACAIHVFIICKHLVGKFTFWPLKNEIYIYIYR